MTITWWYTRDAKKPPLLVANICDTFDSGLPEESRGMSENLHDCCSPWSVRNRLVVPNLIIQNQNKMSRKEGRAAIAAMLTLLEGQLLLVLVHLQMAKT